MPNGEARLAEVVGALTLATDLAAGFGYEAAVRTCVVATAIARDLSLSAADVSDVYYTALLRFLGCTAYAHETAARYAAGDDMGWLAALAPADAARPASVAKYALRNARRNPSRIAGAKSFFATMSDKNGPKKVFSAHCGLAMALAGQLGMSEGVVTALGQMYERFDGKGQPHGLRGEAISLPARILHVAWRTMVQTTMEGRAAATAELRSRSGGELDPVIAASFGRIAGVGFSLLEAPSVWDEFLAAEPSPVHRLEQAGLGRVAAAFGSYADVKSPYTLGHSAAVSRLATRAAREMRLGAEAEETVRVAALVQDLGRVSVPDGIWDKPGPLNAAEWERVRQHPYHTERILGQSPLLLPYARLAGMHHERLDGSGYHRGVAGPANLPREAAVLAAADAYQCKLEERPYRAANSPARAAAELVSLAHSGKLDREAVEGVLAAAGQAATLRGELPGGLTERECEVLLHVAHGLTNKEIGARLSISPRTVQNHLANVFAKTGVMNRAAAAIYAVEHRLF